MKKLQYLLNFKTSNQTPPQISNFKHHVESEARSAYAVWVHLTSGACYMGLPSSCDGVQVCFFHFSFYKYNVYTILYSIYIACHWFCRVCRCIPDIACGYATASSII